VTPAAAAATPAPAPQAQLVQPLGNQSVQRHLRGGILPVGLIAGQQRALGNQAVQRLARRQRQQAGHDDVTTQQHAVEATPAPAAEPVIQRKKGDGHDLTAPRFAGDPVLEAVFDNERLLSVGSNGPAVKKVQEALIEFGCPLPKYGADGKFGAETKTAVKKFQTDSGLTGKAVDGVIGPTTMGLLDKKAGAPGPSPGPNPGPNPGPTPEVPTAEFILQIMEAADPAQLATLRKDTTFLNSCQSMMTAKQFGKAAAMLILVTPADVVSREAAKAEAIRILSTQLGGDKKTARGAIDKNIEVVIIPKNKLMTDVDQFKSLRGVKTFDGRDWEPTRGSGGLSLGGKVFTAITEENLLGEDCTAVYKGKTVSGSYAKGFSTSSHEFAHTLHLFVLEAADKKVITDAYKARKAIAKTKPNDPDQWVDGREGCYASQTEEEFFAQLSNAYLGTNGGTDPFKNDPRQNTKKWVQDHEPTVYAILDRMYAGGSVPNTNPRP
jgi:peptidoglycan hydrolase-like protein with peptidoglycan-binding domain